MKHPGPVLVLVATVLLAGCTSLGRGGASWEEVTARTALKDAPDDILAVFTLESRTPDELVVREGPGWMGYFLAHVDSSPGDGRAAAWGYLSGSMMMEMEGEGHSHAEGASLTVVDSSGKVLYQAAAPSDFVIVPEEPLSPGWVDSDVAATNAADDASRSVVIDPHAYTFSSLAMRVGYPAAWMFESGRSDVQTGDLVAAAASDGLKIKLGNRDPFAPVKTESGAVTKTVSAGSMASDTFRIAYPSHRQIEFFLNMTAAQEGGPVEFTARGPDGQSFPFHYDGSDGTQQSWWQFDAPNPGDWKIEASLDSGTSQGFTVKWCALGASRCP